MRCAITMMAVLAATSLGCGDGSQNDGDGQSSETVGSSGDGDGDSGDGDGDGGSGDGDGDLGDGDGDGDSGDGDGDADACPAATLGDLLGHDRLLIGGSMEDGDFGQAAFDLRYQYLSGNVPAGGPCDDCANGCVVDGQYCDNQNGCAWWG